MTILSVPFHRQISEFASGTAALEMVVRYHHPSKLTKFSQSKIHNRLRQLQPDPGRTYRAKIEDLVRAAQWRGFQAGWGRVSTSIPTMAQHVRYFIETVRIPLIVCQRRTDQDFSFGHFRVVVGIEGDVVLHDPHPETGGANLRWSLDKLDDYWRTTGAAVSGGVAIWINDTPVSPSPLSSDIPNLWADRDWFPRAPAAQPIHHR